MCSYENGIIRFKRYLKCFKQLPKYISKIIILLISNFFRNIFIKEKENLHRII